jgi:hypothetical protein
LEVRADLVFSLKLPFVKSMSIPTVQEMNLSMGADIGMHGTGVEIAGIYEKNDSSEGKCGDEHGHPK